MICHYGNTYHYDYIGNAQVSLWRYLIDSRSIPVTGKERLDMEPIPCTTSFSIVNGEVWYTTPTNGPIALGPQFQYHVN